MTWIDIISYIVLFIALYFQVFLYMTLLTKYGRIRKERAALKAIKTRHDWPSVAVIVPAWNEEATIGGTIESLIALDYPKERLSIIVISDGSKDTTAEIARSYAVKEKNIVVYEKENGGKHSALNFGIERTDATFIGCLDADSFVTPQALKIIIQYFGRGDVMAVCPSVQIWKAESILQKIQATEFLIGALTKKIFTFLGAVYVTPGPFSIYRKSVFDTIGGFRHAFGTEDMEIALRMQSHQMKIETAQDALVYTVAPQSFAALYKQRVRWVSGHLKNTLFSYRFILFKKKYGNLGMLALPLTFVSIGTALFFFGYGVYNFGHTLFEAAVRLVYTGIHFGTPTFEWFFVGSGMKRILVYNMLMLIVVYLILASRLTHRAFRITGGMFYFLFMYGIIAPVWLGKSVWNLLYAKEAPWR